MKSIAASTSRQSVSQAPPQQVIQRQFSGGTLIPDIVSSGSADHSKYQESNDRYHKIRVKQNSILEKIVSRTNGEVNSAHHQSADKIGHGLIGNAISEDGIVEGLERMEPNGKSFLLLVQWHPERMKDQESEFSKNIRESFLEAAREINREER